MPCTWPGDLKLRGGGSDGGVGGHQLLDVLPANVRGLVDALDDTSHTEDEDAPADVAREKEFEFHPGRPPPEDAASSRGGSSLQQPEPGSQEEEATAKDMRESEALQRALGKWKENMKERAKNPRIALMEHPKWGWIQVYTYMYTSITYVHVSMYVCICPPVCMCMRMSCTFRRSRRYTTRARPK
jgi:hypothetical protein